MSVLHIAQLGWNIIQGGLRIQGQAISMTQRLLVSATFGAIQTLQPLLTAALTTGMTIRDPLMITQAMLGFAQLGTALAALITFENNQKDISLQLRGLSFTLSNVSMMLNIGMI